jgi:hypothetical protein
MLSKNSIKKYSALHLFLGFLVCTGSFLLIRPSELLTPILPLFPLLSRRFLNLTRHSNPHLPIMWLPSIPLQG